MPLEGRYLRYCRLLDVNCMARKGKFMECLVNILLIGAVGGFFVSPVISAICIIALVGGWLILAIIDWKNGFL